MIKSKNNHFINFIVYILLQCCSYLQNILYCYLVHKFNINIIIGYYFWFQTKKTRFIEFFVD